jgi:hypothetical protein
LKGFSIDTARIILPPEADGTNFVGEITLPNPSIVAFELASHPIKYHALLALTNHGRET